MVQQAIKTEMQRVTCCITWLQIHNDHICTKILCKQKYLISPQHTPCAYSRHNGWKGLSFPLILCGEMRDLCSQGIKKITQWEINLWLWQTVWQSSTWTVCILCTHKLKVRKLIVRFVWTVMEKIKQYSTALLSREIHLCLGKFQLQLDHKLNWSSWSWDCPKQNIL